MNISNKDSKLDELVKDVVCGMIKPRSQMKAQAIYKGKTYYFCVEQDKQIFVSHPESWIVNK